jgi:NAD(P)-dependent dehydrogenase (short-subunit alcohol dehydrogenase family)
MIANGYGRVITIGSGYATNGGGTISYSAAKHGLVGFTHALAYQVPREITVKELVPMAVLLASPGGAAITGQVISVDGGFKV